MPGFRRWSGPAARRPGRAGIPAISRSGAGRSSSLPPPDMRGTTATATSRATGISLPPSLRGRSGTTRSSRLPCRSRPAPVSACWWRPERTAQVVRSASCMRRARAAPEHGGQADVGSPLAEREVLPLGVRGDAGRRRGGRRVSRSRADRRSIQRRLTPPALRPVLGLLRGASVPALQRLLLPLDLRLHCARAASLRGRGRRRAQAGAWLSSRFDLVRARVHRRQTRSGRPRAPRPRDAGARRERRAVHARLAYIQGGLMSPSKKKPQGDVGLAEPKTKAKPKLDRPRLYKVLLHNDDYTPMEFVVLVLREVFAKSDADATAIMLHAHTHGMAVAGVYTFEIAETKVQQTMALAEKAAFPLLCTMEPEDAPG